MNSKVYGAENPGPLKRNGSGPGIQSGCRPALWRRTCCSVLATVVFIAFRVVSFGSVVFEDTSPYHHVRVIDQNGLRTLCFDDATESRMAVDDPLKGHFEYTEYFHMAWLWNAKITNVLMIGLGGA